MQNYRTGFMQAAREFIEAKRFDMAKELLDQMEVKIPESVIPMTHKELSLQLGRLYLEIGDTVSFSRRLDQFIARTDLKQNDYYLLAEIYYFDLGDFDNAEKSILYASGETVTNPKYVSFLYQIYEKSKQYDKALELLDNWGQGQPEDAQTKSLRRNILNKMKTN